MDNQDWAKKEANKIVDRWMHQLLLNRFPVELTDDIANKFRKLVLMPTAEEIKQAEALRSAQIETNYDPHAFTAGALWVIRQITGEKENG